MRLFIAVQLNDEMKNALLQIQHSMQMQGVRGNYTREENLHLTLAFIGEYPDPYDVKEILEEIDFEPFRIRLDGVGSFGSLWWAGIAEDGDCDDALRFLAKRVRRGLAEAGIPYDRKKFSPHITLVRKPQVGGERVSGRGGIPEEVLQGLRDPQDQTGAENLPQAGMIVDHISLMRSDRGKHGMIYTEL